MVKKIGICSVTTDILDCACVIHGNTYSWDYVEKLYNMLDRHVSNGIRLHVYTEASRPVPEPMIKHALTDWGFSGPKSSWWYKLQMFDSQHHAGPLLYFDLDTVIVNNIDWIQQLPLNYFWTLRDFKYLWRATHYSMNSSVMWWDTRSFGHVWTEFLSKDLHSWMKKYRGDQDYLHKAIGDQFVRYLEQDRVKSWRWQCLDGGYDFRTKTYPTPGSGTVIPENTDILVFHGQPKPADLQDATIISHWR